MKNMRSLVIGASAIALVCGVAWVLAPKRQTVQQDPPRPAVVHRSAKSLRPKSIHHWTEPRMARAPVQQEPLAQESTPPASGTLRPRPVEPQTKAYHPELEAAQANAVTPDATQTPQDTPADQEAIQDLMAQAALAYVGVEPGAETYGDEASNDPSLSAQEAQGMIEDSNEDDLSDPEDPATEDLP